MCLSIFFAYYTNLLISGYHLVDDHEIIRIHSHIQSNGFFNTLILWLKSDLAIRFRPTYWLLRVSETALLGDNMFLWHIVQAVVTGVGTFSVYVLSRKMNCHYALSVVFSFIILCGEQCAIIWRLGPQEGWGLMFVAVSYICVINYHNNASTKNLILLSICSILLAGIKESFLVIVPTEILFLAYLQICSEQNSSSKHSIFYFLKKS